MVRVRCMRACVCPLVEPVKLFCEIIQSDYLALWGFRNFDSCLRTFYTLLLKVASIFPEPPEYLTLLGDKKIQRESTAQPSFRTDSDVDATRTKV
jgi:hypothetical protein